MGKSLFLTDNEIDFLDRTLEGLIVEEDHADIKVCDSILEKIHK